MSVTPVELYGNDFNVNTIHDGYKVSSDKTSTSFDSIFSAAVDMYKEADHYQKVAEAEEMSFALGFIWIFCSRSSMFMPSGSILTPTSLAP